MNQKKTSAKLSDQFRQLLSKDFSERQKRNPRYSLKAYSILLGANYSHLSRIISGERGLTYKQFKIFAKKAGISFAHLEASFADLIAKNPKASVAHIFSPDQFKKIGKLKTAALLDYVRHSRPCFDSEKIAEETGYSKQEVKSIIDLCIECGLLKIDSVGNLMGSTLGGIGYSEALDEENQKVLHQNRIDSQKIVSNYIHSVDHKQALENSNAHTRVGTLAQYDGFLTEAQKAIIDNAIASLISKMAAKKLKKAQLKKEKNKAAVFIWTFNVVPYIGTSVKKNGS